ncbi:MAG: FKBP-type peptidyl-prolyl cis-trans isomerase [Pseudomonadota bacterium]
MTRILMISLFLTLLLAAKPLIGLVLAEPEKPVSEIERISYSLGHQIGSDFKEQGNDLDPEALGMGLSDALGDEDPLVSPEVMISALVGMKRRIVARQQTEKVEMREQRLASGKAFLEKNAARADVVVLPSGLQYEILKAGNGQKPGPTDRVKVHYEGSLIDGTVIGSSRRKGNPETFYVSGVMEGLTEAFQLMKEGAHWKVYVPPGLGIGNRGELANRVLIYDLELISVEPNSYQ